MTVIELPDQEAAALKVRAAAQGPAILAASWVSRISGETCSAR